VYYAQVKEAWIKRGDNISILIEMTMPEVSYTMYGAPETVWIEHVFVLSEEILQTKLQLFNKTATRLPEAAWFSFK
jgi:hypothetical protein